MKELLEQRVSEILDAIGGDLTNNQLADVADHLNAFVDYAVELAKESAPAGVDALALVLDPILEMTLRVSTLLDAMQKAAKK